MRRAFAAAALTAALAARGASAGDDELAERCASGKLDAAFVAAFDARVEADLVTSPFGPALPAGFLDRLRARPEVRDELWLAVARIGPKAAWNFSLLETAAPDAVATHPQLAIGFAAAWAAGKEREPRRFWIDHWMEEGRKIPSMAESFAWFVAHEKEMRLSMRDTPWPVLAHLADGYTPLVEREWVLGKWGGVSTNDLRGFVFKVPYRVPKRAEPCTLESFVRLGGICVHNVQFADGVFESFGIPGGWSGGPGHVWPYWFEQNADGELRFHRTNDLGNRTGTIRDPLSNGSVMEDDLRLLATACNVGERKRFLASAATWAFEHLPGRSPATTAAVLDAAVRMNPWCGEACRALAKATASRRLPLDVAGAAWRVVGQAQVRHLDFLLDRLDEALPPEPRVGEAAAAPTIDGEGPLLDGIVAACEEAKRPGMAAKAQFLRARCLRARGETAKALALYQRLAREIADVDDGHFQHAVNSALDLLLAPGDAYERRTFLEKIVASTRPESFDRWRDAQSSHAYAVRRLVEDLRAHGDVEAGDKLWLKELLDWRPFKGDGTAFGDVHVGGDGGKPFLDMSKGALLRGLTVTIGELDDRPIVGAVQGVFETAEGKRVYGPVHGRQRGAGRPNAKELEVLAPEGWVVAGVVACGSKRLDGFALLFAPRDPLAGDLRFSAWIGGRSGRETLIGGPRCRISCVRGRAGSDVDALGLLADSK